MAVINNGTAVLGLGDIGPEASKPVMEGKGFCSRCLPTLMSLTSRLMLPTWTNSWPP